ncbi:hypothetical protein SPURM210S_07592 [Streptomyces purpurascens]
MRRPQILLAALVLAVCCVVPATPAAAAQTIGFPSFSGPAIPAPPVAHTSGDMMRAIYDAESSGTDFWMDRMLARTGEDPAGAWLFTRGRALFMKEHAPARLGFAGKVAYWESIDDRSAYTVTLTPTARPSPCGRTRGAGTQTPSYWRREFTHEATGLKVDTDEVHHRGRTPP